MEPIPFTVANLSLDEHTFAHHHFCRGNTGKHKARLGLIEEGQADFIWLNRKISVRKGDIIFIPEKVFCYSEWTGSPTIRVFYLSFSMHNCRDAELELQTLSANADSALLQDIRTALQGDATDQFTAYALLYRFLAQVYPTLKRREQPFDRPLCDAINYITENYNRNFSVQDVARAVCVSESKLYHLFQEQLGQSPVQYLMSLKVNYAMKFLEDRSLSVGEICTLTNFHSESYFRRVFKSVTDMSPTEYRRRLR